MALIDPRLLRDLPAGINRNIKMVATITNTSNKSGCYLNGSNGIGTHGKGTKGHLPAVSPRRKWIDNWNWAWIFLVEINPIFRGDNKVNPTVVFVALGPLIGVCSILVPLDHYHPGTQSTRETNYVAVALPEQLFCRSDGITATTLTV